MSKILFVVTSHKILGETDKKTGFHFSEMGEPYAYLKSQGHAIDFASPLGGPVEFYGYNTDDSWQKTLMEDETLQNLLANTRRPDQIAPRDYEAIYFVGGHGTMWDFPNNKGLAAITREMYEADKAVAAICHGASGIMNVKLSGGKYLVDGKHIAAFSDGEERAIKLESVVPFLLETKLKERGAIYTKTAPWGVHVEVDGRLVTGQNPASARLLAKSLGDVIAAQVADRVEELCS